MAIRKIIFRGKDIGCNEWVYGHYTEGAWIDPQTGEITKRYIIHGEDGFLHDIAPETLGEFTGIVDKNGKEIYEGDIVEFYCLNTYCINPDCEAHLLGYSNYIRKETAEVDFFDSSFGIEDSYSGNFTPLAWCGLHEDLNDLKEMQKNDAYFDTMGYDIDDSIIGIKVIGNIHDNKKESK